MSRLPIVRTQKIGRCYWPERLAGVRPGRRTLVATAANFKVSMAELRDEADIGQAWVGIGALPAEETKSSKFCVIR